MYAILCYQMKLILYYSILWDGHSTLLCGVFSRVVCCYGEWCAGIAYYALYYQMDILCYYVLWDGHQGRIPYDITILSIKGLLHPIHSLTVGLLIYLIL